DYGHVLVYGVNEDILARFDFRNVRLPAQELIGEVARLGGIALPCHPGRPTVGLCAHYETKPPLHGVVAVEAINGGSRKGEDERVEELIHRYGYQAYGGSDSHLVSFVGICATEFEAEIRSIEDLVRELKGGRYRPVDTIDVRSTLHEVYEKTGRTGSMYFVVIRFTMTNQRGEMVAVVDNRFMHR